MAIGISLPALLLCFALFRFAWLSFGLIVASRDLCPLKVAVVCPPPDFRLDLQHVRDRTDDWTIGRCTACLRKNAATDAFTDDLSRDPGKLATLSSIALP